MELNALHDSKPAEAAKGIPIPVVKQCLSLCQSIKFLMATNSAYHDVNITTSDFTRLESMALALTPFEEATTLLSGQKYVTISSVVPVFDLIISDLEDLLVRNATLANMINSMSAKLHEYQVRNSSDPRR